MKKLILIALLALSLAGYSQQEPLFSQYMFNKITVNPAYAGSREVLSADMVYRYQWVGMPGSPRTMTLSMHAPMRNNHIGLGGFIYNDELGPVRDMGALATYAYRIMLPKGKLALGLQAGIKYYNVDWEMIRTEDPDITFQPQLTGKITPDANVGIYYYSNRVFAGISSKHLFQNEYAFVNDNGEKTYTRLMRHFYGMAGLALPISDKVIFRPSALVKYVPGAPWQLDLNASFLLNDVIWFGVSYRTNGDMAILTELNIGRRYRLGYSYDINLKDMIHHNSGSHEIRLGIDLDLLKNRMYTPRYF
jgi:type IX secretion system PorP/SprF family membrane protein